MAQFFCPNLVSDATTLGRPSKVVPADHSKARRRLAGREIGFISQELRDRPPFD
jgi:hypothetical protein